jgi:CubicO group peptidase (beta-lactamase class C family)
MRNLLAFVIMHVWVGTCWANGPSLPRSTPEEQGISSSGILDFITAADAKIQYMHGFMLLRHGHVVAEGWWAPYSAESRHALFSLSKSFTSTAVGLAVNEGKLTVDDEVIKFFPDDLPASPSANLKAMRVRDLLTMSAGHHGDDLDRFDLFADERLTRVFLSLPVAHKPGTLFTYNTPATFMQSAIVQQVTGQNLVEYLRPRLFEPLGISDPKWVMTKQGIAQGGTGLSLRTEEIARFGQLYLQKGQWNGKQLIPASWIETATSRQESNGSQPTSDWDQGYGYQFWRCRHGFYRGDGAFGQFCVVMPSLDAVVAMNGGTRDLGGVLNLVWDKLVPAIQSSATLPPDPTNQGKLKSALAALTIPPAAGKPTSPNATSISGRTFVVPKNEQHLDSLALEIGASDDILVIGVGEKQHRITCGRGAWQKGRTMLATDLQLSAIDEGDQPVAASGGWTRPDTYIAKLSFYESPVLLTIKVRFGGDFALIDIDPNVGFGTPTTRPQLMGEVK